MGGGFPPPDGFDPNGGPPDGQNIPGDPLGLGPGGQRPAGAAGGPRYAIVAVVPVDIARERFLDHLINDQQGHDVNAVLVNDSGDILAGSNVNAVGSNLLSQLSAGAREKLAPLVSREEAPPVVLEQAFTLGGATVPPQIVASAQLEVPSGRHWTILISSSVADAENVVNSVMRSAVLWGAFVSLSITALLGSTSAFMIRSRVRFERMRHEVLTRELEQARHIQLAWLPDVKSAPSGLTVWAANLPASHISGDFYNWFALPAQPAAGSRSTAHVAGAQDGDKIAVVIGDVTGHGIPAAFLMATTQLLVRATLTRSHDPARCLREVNRQLCTQGFQGQFVTMLIMVLDRRDNTLEVATAGHPNPLIARDGRFQELDLEPQLVLGVDPDEQYRSQSFILEPGASVLLYTDGVVEAEGPSGAQYGVQKLIQVLDRQLAAGPGGAGGHHGPPAPEQQIRAVLDDVNRFCGGRELNDDVTLVAVRTTAPEPVAGETPRLVSASIR
jgi:serine phosphatase RsbU (regulator of sigma subunit)